MSTAISEKLTEPSFAPAAQAADLRSLIDRWIYVFMALLLIVVTLTGFIPDSLMKIGLVEAGQRAPFPLVLHLHAVAMGSWLLLLLAQTTLMATGRSAGHRSLGMIAMVLAPVLVIVGIVLSPTMYRLLWTTAQAMPGGPDEAALAELAIRGNITLIQMQVGIVFAILVTLALRARKYDQATHKRLMILAPIVALPAAVDRISWLPNTMPASPLGPDLYVLLLAMPMFAWDLYRLRRVQRAYVIWLGVFLPVAGVAYALWNTPWWQAFVPRLMGVV